jgi:hypothetical protein
VDVLAPSSNSQVFGMSDGSPPAEWGEYFWGDVEGMIEACPAAVRGDARGALAAVFRFMLNIGLYLPCRLCRNHYVEHYTSITTEMHNKGITLTKSAITRVQLHYLWWRIHDAVNAFYGKQGARRAYNWQWYQDKYPGARGSL